MPLENGRELRTYYNCIPIIPLSSLSKYAIYMVCLVSFSYSSTTAIVFYLGTISARTDFRTIISILPLLLNLYICLEEPTIIRHTFCR